MKNEPRKLNSDHQIVSLKQDYSVMLFLDPFQAPKCSVYGVKFPNIFYPLNPPAAANFFEVCVLMRVNLKTLKKGTTIGEKNDFLDRGGSKQNTHPCEITELFSCRLW